MEMINTPSDPRAAATFQNLQQNIIPTGGELRTAMVRWPQNRTR
jgi:hypothetical protein